MSTEAKRRSAADVQRQNGSNLAGTVIGLVTVFGGLICFALLIVFGMGHG